MGGGSEAGGSGGETPVGVTYGKIIALSVQKDFVCTKQNIRYSGVSHYNVIL